MLVKGATGRNGLKFDMFMYPGHHQNWLCFVMVCWFSSFWRTFDLVRRADIGVSAHYECMEQMVRNLAGWFILQNWLDGGHAMLLLLILTRFDLVGRAKLCFPLIIMRTHAQNGLKFDMLMYPDHPRNWPDFGRGLLIIFIFAVPVLRLPAYLTELWRLSDATAVRSPDLLVYLGPSPGIDIWSSIDCGNQTFRKILTIE